MYQKFTSVEQKLEGIDKAIEGEVSKGISSSFQIIDARMRGGGETSEVRATLSKVPIKGGAIGKIASMFRLG